LQHLSWWRLSSPWPGNAPTSRGGIYLIAYEGERPVACGALSPIDKSAVEIRRMYVLKHFRRFGLA